MKLFTLKNYRLEIAEEALTIKAFSVLWKRDKSKDKSKATQELSIIYFMYDPRSDYRYLSDDDERLLKIIEHEGLSKNYKLDKQMLAAAEVYKELIHTPSSLLLEQAGAAMEKVREFLAKVDLDKTDDKGKAVYPINQITSALKDIPRLAKEYQEALKAVTLELEEKNNIRGNKTKSLFEDGFEND